MLQKLHDLQVRLDVSDGVYLLNFLFQGGPPPAAPGPASCGTDRTDDTIPDCVYTSC